MLKVLFQDDYYVAVHKSAGLLVHRSAIDRLETRFALQLTRDLIGQRVYPVHRLDKPTSGTLLFALSSEAAHAAMLLFSSGRIDKEYLAVVRGYTLSQDCIDYPLIEQHDAMTDARANTSPIAQAAVTDYQQIAQVELPHAVGRYATARYSMLKLRPRHGRKHQIRRHMKHIFHPIVGDTSHGDGRHNTFFREQFDCHRLLLAATRLTFVHPFSNAQVRIDAPLEASFTRITDALGWGMHTRANSEIMSSNI
jgi:tRNA pseudouridine65 synthase